MERIVPYLHVERSKGPGEDRRPRGTFWRFNQLDLDVMFFAALALRKEGLMRRVCLPHRHLCIQPRPTDGHVVRARCDSTSAQVQRVRAGIVMLGLSTSSPKVIFAAGLPAQIRSCEKKKVAFSILNFGLYPSHTDSFGHANGLLLNHITHTIERYEPHGSAERAYNDRQDDAVRKLFQKQNVTRDWNYVGVRLTRIEGPQYRVDAYGGMCVTYAAMFVTVRLLHPKIHPADIYHIFYEISSGELLQYVLKFNKFMIETVKLYDDTMRPGHTRGSRINALVIPDDIFTPTKTRSGASIQYIADVLRSSLTIMSDKSRRGGVTRSVAIQLRRSLDNMTLQYSDTAWRRFARSIKHILK